MLRARGGTAAAQQQPLAEHMVNDDISLRTEEPSARVPGYGGSQRGFCRIEVASGSARDARAAEGRPPSGTPPALIGLSELVSRLRAFPRLAFCVHAEKRRAKARARQLSACACDGDRLVLGVAIATSSHPGPCSPAGATPPPGTAPLGTTLPMSTAHDGPPTVYYIPLDNGTPHAWRAVREALFGSGGKGASGGEGGGGQRGGAGARGAGAGSSVCGGGDDERAGASARAAHACPGVRERVHVCAFDLKTQARLFGGAALNLPQGAEAVVTLPPAHGPRRFSDPRALAQLLTGDTDGRQLQLLSLSRRFAPDYAHAISSAEPVTPSHAACMQAALTLVLTPRLEASVCAAYSAPPRPVEACGGGRELGGDRELSGGAREPGGGRQLTQPSPEQLSPHPSVVSSQSLEAHAIEMALSVVLARMELEGIVVDTSVRGRSATQRTPPVFAPSALRPQPYLWWG
jgi:hypothetical protein